MWIYFRCDEQCLEDSLCKRVMVTRDETITKSLNAADAALSRDALAKIVYSRLFDWFVLATCYITTYEIWRLCASLLTRDFFSFSGPG